MNIEPDEKLDFSDVLIRPKRSTLQSRSQVSLERSFTPKYGKSFSGVPIMAANMATGTFNMLHTFMKHKMFVAIAKFLNEEWYNEFDANTGVIKYGFYTIGMNERELYDLKKFYNYVNKAYELGTHEVDHNGVETRTPHADEIKICVDIANGYTQRFAEFVSKVRTMFPNNVIIAGNVATPEMVQELIINGADYVKVGIGPGCLEKDTRILMSNGTYKDIIDVNAGDRIITMNGTPASVKDSYCTGEREVISCKTNTFYKPSVLTPDHKCYVGDLSSTSIETIKSRGYAKLLAHQSKTIPKSSKLKWKEIGEIEEYQNVGLMPNDITWELPIDFNYDISKYFRSPNHDASYNKQITSTYNLGYLFGFFLGDGSSHQDKKNHTGRISFAVHKNDSNYIKKLHNVIYSVVGKHAVDRITDNVNNVTVYSRQWAVLLAEFGKRHKKHLPDKYYCLNSDYLRGLYDGLIDSDGNIESNGIHTHNDRHRFTNTSIQLIELFGFLTYNLFGYFPEYSSGEIPKNNGKNKVYRVRHTINGQISKRVVDDYQCVKLSPIESKSIKTDVYDLEIDDASHSFIANNMIVHNSVCTTRKQTGVGYPQVSASIECSDAAHGLDGGIVLDGGMRTPADIAKAFCSNADFVMVGGMFAGTQECHGEIITRYFENPEFYEYLDNDTPTLTRCEPIKKTYKVFYGMSSEYAQDRHNGGMKNYRSSEGRVEEVEYKGKVEPIIMDLLGGLRSTGTYIGANSVKNFGKCATFVRVNRIHDKF